MVTLGKSTKYTCILCMSTETKQLQIHGVSFKECTPVPILNISPPAPNLAILNRHPHQSILWAPAIKELYNTIIHHSSTTYKLYPTLRMDVMSLGILFKARLKHASCCQFAGNTCAITRKERGWNAVTHVQKRHARIITSHPFSK